jgi:YggT family protein
MLYQIISFLLEVATGLLGSACLLRVYMQYQRISFRNPVGSLVFALTDWMVLPLRRVIPAMGGWDIASLLGAFLLKLGQYLVLWLMMGSVGNVLVLPVLAVFGLAAMAIYGLTGVLIIYAVLSWMQTRSPMADIIERLCEPPLRPLRKIIPLVSGVDLSPLALLVILQVASIVLGHLMGSVMSTL